MHFWLQTGNVLHRRDNNLVTGFTRNMISQLVTHITALKSQDLEW